MNEFFKELSCKVKVSLYSAVQWNKPTRNIVTRHDNYFIGRNTEENLVHSSRVTMVSFTIRRWWDVNTSKYCFPFKYYTTTNYTKPQSIMHASDPLLVVTYQIELFYHYTGRLSRWRQVNTKKHTVSWSFCLFPWISMCLQYVEEGKKTLKSDSFHEYTLFF